MLVPSVTMHCELCHKEILERFAPANKGIFYNEKRPDKWIATWLVWTCFTCTVKAIHKEYRNIYGDERNEQTGRLIASERANTVRVINVTRYDAAQKVGV